MRAIHLFSLGLCCAASAGCQPASPPPVEKPDPTLAKYVLDRLPEDIGHSRFLDFGGKVQLLGYDIEPEGELSPGSQFKITMYWKSVAPLGPGWKLFTHLRSADGVRVEPEQGLAYDNIGPLRSGPAQALPPSAWQPGKFYVDEQALTLESNPNRFTPQMTLVVGVWKDKSRLDVLSGPSDGEQGGIVMNFETGVAPRVPVAASAAVTQAQP